MARVIVVVPCYNEADRLDTAAFQSFSLPGHELAILFVDDGSRDQTLPLLERLGTERPGAHSFLALPVNRGKAEAVRQGFLAALERSPEYIAFWDADLAAPLAELTRFVRIIDGDRAIQMVFGSRVKLLGRTIERRPVRHYLGRVFATAVSLNLRLPVYDTQCGAKLFRATPALKEVMREPFLSRWIFDVEIIARFQRQHWEAGGPPLERAIYECPLEVWRDIHGSKLRPRDFLKAIGDLWRIRRRYLRCPPRSRA